MALKRESDRMIYLDLLRILASLMIIVYHFQNQMSLGRWASSVRASLDGLTVSVDLFFFISGFVISSIYTGRVNNSSAYKAFISKRIARIVPLHWATFAVFAVFGVLHATGHLPSNHPELYDARCAAPNLLLLHAFGLCSSLTFNYVSWSISAEMGMYLIFPLLVPLVSRRVFALVSVAVIVALLTAVAIKRHSSWLDWTFDFGVLRALPAFLLGMTSFTYRDRLSTVPMASAWLLVACLALIGGCLVQCPKPLLLLIAYAIGLLGVAASEQPIGRIPRRLAPLGQLTYSVYMLHPLVQTVLLTGIGATFLKLKGLPMNLFVIASILAMIPIGWLSLVLFERPSRRWINRLLLGRGRESTDSGVFTPDSRW